MSSAHSTMLCTVHTVRCYVQCSCFERLNVKRGDRDNNKDKIDILESTGGVLNIDDALCLCLELASGQRLLVGLLLALLGHQLDHVVDPQDCDCGLCCKLQGLDLKIKFN